MGLAGSQKAILMFGMICSGFLTAAERMELRALARDGLSEARVARRANAIVLLNDGWSCEEVATALLIDDDTVRSWHDLYACLLYTSDAADDLLCVDLGGRRIIKKTKKHARAVSSG